MTRELKITENTNPKDVYLYVTCQETGKGFRFGLDGAQTIKTCRCGRETFEAHAEPTPGYLVIELYVTYRWGEQKEVPNFDVRIDKE